MATRNPSSKNSALKLIPKTPTTKAGKAPSEREAIIQEVLDAITLGECSVAAPTTSREADDDFLINNHFAHGASQINADLAVAAQCESEGDFSAGGDEFIDFYASTEFDKLRQTFLDDVKDRLRMKIEKDYCSSVDDPLHNFASRIYYAGLLSPERKEPDSAYVRAERRRREELQHQEHLKRMAAK